MANSEAIGRPAWFRLGGGACVGLTEYLVLAVLLDGSQLGRVTGLWSHLTSLGQLAALAFAVLAAGVLLDGPALSAAARRASWQPGPYGLHWTGLHFAAYAAFAACSFRLFSGEPATPVASVLWVVAWFLLALLSAATLFLAACGRAAKTLATALLRACVSGLALGVLAWLLGVASRPLWDDVAQYALALSALFLIALHADVAVDFENSELGLESFAVEVAPQCSGMEGVGLISVFVVGYLYRFRKHLRFPNALVLLPLALAVAWIGNSVRIAALILVGEYWSADVAYGGFHSKVGWILFCGIALAVVHSTQRLRFFSRHQEASSLEYENPTAAYCMPFLILLLLSMVTAALSADFEHLYALKVLGSLVALGLYRRYYRDFERRISWVAPALGGAVFAVWLVLSPGGRPLGMPGELARAAPAILVVWVVFRVLGSVFVVPIVEELAFRGFLQRRLVGEDFTAVSLRTLTVPSVALSALAFGALHQAWLAGTVAGVAYSLAGYWRGRLFDAIAAHATTNGLISFWVLALGRWDLW